MSLRTYVRPKKERRKENPRLCLNPVRNRMEIRNKFGIIMAAAVSRPDLIAVGGNCLYIIMPSCKNKTHTDRWTDKASI